MDLQFPCHEQSTPVGTFNSANSWKAEDSGYFTSFTPSSLECTNLSLGKFQSVLPHDCIEQQTVDYLYTSNNNSSPLECKPSNSGACCTFTESPITRRGIKRPYPDEKSTELNFPTPTNGIARRIQRLKVDDNDLSKCLCIPELNENSNPESIQRNNLYTFSYPSTPVKRRNCNKSSPNKSSDYTRWSPSKRRIPLTYEIQGLQPVEKSRARRKIVKYIHFKPDQKVDIVKLLWQRVRCRPAIKIIFKYLSKEDIYRFSLVSPVWLQVCESVTTAASQRQEYIKTTKENLENKDKGVTPIKQSSNQMCVLKNYNKRSQNKSSVPNSPPGTPRTIRFKKFTKSASLDARSQLCCVRCRQPAKVTKEVSGEEWAECCSTSCSYVFCRFCMCDRHTGKSCLQFDLDGPSPSKNRRNSAIPVVGSKKSKKNLKRLLRF